MDFSVSKFVSNSSQIPSQIETKKIHLKIRLKLCDKDFTDGSKSISNRKSVSKSISKSMFSCSDLINSLCCI